MSSADGIRFRRIDQIVAGFAEGDAISNEVVTLQNILISWGIQSDVYADTRHVCQEMQSKCKPLDSYDAGSEDLAIHHYSIGSPAIETFMASKAKKLLLYHNITPEHFLQGYNDSVAGDLRGAREQLRAVLPGMDAVWAVSEFNAGELREMGAKNTEVFPLLFDPTLLDLEPDVNVFNKFVVPMTNFLFVGRISPNKHIEDLMQAFTWYYHMINRQSRLIIVGSERTTPRYYLMLQMLINEWELPNVCFERFASPRGLPAYYELADVFVTASQHEGYCLPLVEAMHKRVPVIALKNGGIPEALNGAGIMYEDATPGELAELMHRAVTDNELRRKVLKSQDRRMEEIRGRDIEKELKDLLARV